jgi:kynurenine formamidase
MARFIDISHPIRDGMLTYPGLPAPRSEVLLDYDASRARYADQAEFFIASLHLCGNTGTYVDAPIHRFRGATDLAALSLERLAHLPTVVVDTDARAIGAKLFAGIDVAGRAVIVRTGFSEHFGTDRYQRDNPFLTEEACRSLVAGRARFVGIDSLNVDDVTDPSRPAHTTLLGAGIPVCEHLTRLDQVPLTGGRLHAVPIPWVGGATFPVRAYVVLEQ